MINIERSIIKVLAYFNIFNYPLEKDEIYNFLDINCERGHFENAIDSLCDDGILYRIDEFYSLQKNISLAERRKNGSKLAAVLLKKAGQISRFLYGFPFVKGIAVSGSLSKNYAEKNSDIDFFIITTANRLWIARTCMHMFKKITFITGRQHCYCMNYYIDEQGLEIKEKNVFTAIETMTVMPFCDDGIFETFFSANKWAKSFLPLSQPKIIAARHLPKTISKSVIEKVFNNAVGNWLNDRLMSITMKRWKNKAEQHQRSYRGELMGLDDSRHYAKPDPANFQKRILYRYSKEVEAFMMRLENVNSV
ncbi:MAG: nucleotidyltransferase domain-containing protein [Bacteroidota bacterium]